MSSSLQPNLTEETQDWPVCNRHNCQNRVHPARVKAGHLGCVERHQTPLNMPTTVPMPKSATVVGTREDLYGISSSHKTGVTGPSTTNFGRYASVRPAAPKPSTLASPRELLLERLRASTPRAGGVYISGDRALVLAYRLGYVTSRSEPARLTAKGLLAREVARRGRVPAELE